MLNTLRYVVTTAAAIITMNVLACMDFPVRFDRIRGDELRVTAVSFTPHAEAAPGDTMAATVHFGGDPVIRVDSFQVTYTVIQDPYGSVDTFTNVRPLVIIDSLSRLPDSLRIYFAIPQEVIYGQLADYMARSGASAGQMQAFEAMAGYMGGNVDIPPDSLLSFLGSISRESAEEIVRFATRGRLIFETVSQSGRHLTVHAGFVVRYNSWFSGLYERARARYPEAVVDSAVDDKAEMLLSVNNNPQINWMGVCKVKGKNAWQYHPLSTTSYIDTLYLLYHNSAYIPDTAAPVDAVRHTDTITIDTGYTYFFLADSGSGDYDGDGYIEITQDRYLTQYTPRGDTVPRDTIQYEFYNYRWFYQNRDASDMPLDSLLTIQQGTLEAVKRMYVPLDTAMHDFRVWCVVQDWTNGQYMRPEATISVCAEAVFRYTDAYAQSVAGR